MAITGGFGFTMDLGRGTMRQWYMGRDGVKRWADTGEPVDHCAEHDATRDPTGDSSHNGESNATR